MSLKHLKKNVAITRPCFLGFAALLCLSQVLGALETRSTRTSQDSNESRAFLPGLKGLTFPGPRTDLLSISEEKAIRLLYADYLGKIQASGQEMSLELSNFFTLYRNEFSKLFFDDLITSRPGSTIQNSITEYGDREGNSYGNTYQAFWLETEADSEWPAKPRPFTVDDIVAHMERDLRHWAGVVALTVFDVQVTLADLTYSYSAGVFWRVDGDGRFAAIPQDSVIYNIDAVISLETPAVDPDDIPELVAESAFLLDEKAELRKSQGALEDINSTAECDSTFNSIPTPGSTAGDVTNHAILPGGAYAGIHVAYFKPTFTCSCRSDCQQTCSGFLASENQRCEDTFGSALGDPDATHRGWPKSKVTIGISERGDRTPAECAFDHVCVIQQCFLDRVCDPIQIVFAPGGLGFRWTPYGEGVVWEKEVAFTLLCDFCEIQDQTPILLDLDEAGIRLTDLNSGVAFDIDGDGMPNRISWVAPNTGDAFLALDRNENGRVDSGKELFGDSTAQPEVHEPNGFLALAVFDAYREGGNSDGWITSEDAIFDRLRLWFDLDADAVTDSGELVPLRNSGIQGIRLSYVEARRRDRFGNRFRWAAMVRFEDGQQLAAIDVIFLQE